MFYIQRRRQRFDTLKVAITKLKYKKLPRQPRLMKSSETIAAVSSNQQLGILNQRSGKRSEYAKLILLHDNARQFVADS